MNKKKYKLIIFQNNKQYRKIKDYSRQREALQRFEKLKAENKENIIIPKQKISTDHGRLKTVRYELVLLQRKTDEKIKPRKYTNEFGEKVQEKELNGWIIIKKCAWIEEEIFWVSTLKKQYTFIQIFDNILKPRYGYFTTVFIFLNKVVIDDGEKIDIVQCKTERESLLLYETIKKHIIDLKRIEFLFTGYLSAESRKEIRPRLIEITGLNRREFYRRSSAKPEKS